MTVFRPKTASFPTRRAYAATQYQILKIIRSRRGPVASGAISQGLRQAGLDLSEVTVGRILRDLDREGYTMRDGFRGRVLAKKGKHDADGANRATVDHLENLIHDVKTY